jgi:hypothetical protein
MTETPPTGDFTQMPGNWRLYGTPPRRKLVRLNEAGMPLEWIYEDGGGRFSTPEFTTKLAELQRFAREQAVLKIQERELVAARESDDREDGRRRAEARRAAEEIASASSTEHTTEFWVRRPGQPKSHHHGPVDTAADARLIASLLNLYSPPDEGDGEWEAYVVETTEEERLI